MINYDDECDDPACACHYNAAWAHRAARADKSAQNAKELGPIIGTTFKQCEPNLGVLEESVKLMLQGLGEDLTRPDLVDTPKRVAKMWAETLNGYYIDPKEYVTNFPNDSEYEGPVILKNAELYSMCAHHLLPFIGSISIAYEPGNTIIGLSKLLRIARVYAKRLQNQETMTQQIVEALDDCLKPNWVIVRYEAEHYCMRQRGTRINGATTVTIARKVNCRRIPDNVFSL